jgi:hypothetical protein
VLEILRQKNCGHAAAPKLALDRVAAPQTGFDLLAEFGQAIFPNG